MANPLITTSTPINTAPVSSTASGTSAVPYAPNATYTAPIYGGASTVTNSTPYTPAASGTSIAPIGTTTAPAVITGTQAADVVNNAQQSTSDKLAGGAAISSAKSNLTTSYDANGNMVQTGGVLPNGSTYTNTIPKGAPGYISNPADVAANQAKMADIQKQIAETQNTLSLAKAAGYTDNEQIQYDANGNIIPATKPLTPGPNGVDTTSQDGQATWYNTDPKAYESWAKENNISSDEQFQVKILAGNQQLQSLQVQGNNALNQYLTGTFPLTAAQQAQVDGLKQMWEGTINSQRNANDTYVSASAMASARSGGQYDPLGSLAQAQRAIQTGLDRITVFQGAEATAVNNLIQSFQDKDYKAVTDNLTIQAGLTEAITNNLKTVNDAIVKAKDDAQAQANYVEQKQYTEVTKPINDVAASAAQNGAPQSIQDKINAAKTVQDAIAAAGDWLQQGTGTLGDYIQYKRDTEQKGLVPMDYSDYKDLQDKKAQQDKLNLIYAQAAATASANATEGDKVQQKLEQQYRTGLKTMFSSRSGALGIVNNKIVQANSADALFNQFYDPKTGNYNIPSSQYEEVALALASIITNTGTATQQEVESLKAATAKGDFNKAVQYFGGVPQNGTTQKIIQNLVHSVDREAETALQERDQLFESLKAQARPTDLDQNRADQLEQTFTKTFGYNGQDRIDEGALNTYLKMQGKTPLTQPITTSEGKTITNTGDLIVEALQQPGQTDSTVLQWLKDNNYIQ